MRQLLSRFSDWFASALAAIRSAAPPVSPLHVSLDARKRGAPESPLKRYSTQLELAKRKLTGL